ncbi:MAG: InlB B-repeat-containing protein [Clostridium sp.]
MMQTEEVEHHLTSRNIMISTITLRSGKPTRKGYLFKGMVNKKYGIKCRLSAGDRYSSNSKFNVICGMGTNQILCILQCQWGSGAPFEQWKYYDSTLVLRSGTPIRVGYTFKGWSTSSTATSASYMPGGTYTANRDMTLYAVWKAMPTATPTPRPGLFNKSRHAGYVATFEHVFKHRVIYTCKCR